MGVGPNGVQASVSEQVGDQDEVGATADQGSGEGMPPGVSGDGVIQPGGLGDSAKDGAGATGGQPAAGSLTR